VKTAVVWAFVTAAGIAILSTIVSYATRNRSGESKPAEPKSSFFTDTGAKYVKKGDQCQESEDYVEAIEWYQKAIDVNPKNAAACLGMGHAHLELEKAKLAVKWYQQAIDLKPKYTEEITHTLYFAGLAFYVDDKEGRMLTCLRYAAQLGHRDSQKFLRENDYSW
jgi:tetratricopeptide (TPR) repeat protein